MNGFGYVNAEYPLGIHYNSKGSFYKHWITTHDTKWGRNLG